MTCPSCPFIVKKSLTRVDGVKSVKISLEELTAWVKFDDAKTTLAQVIASTGNAGYPSELVK